MEKYYTPEISEFYLGFEYEFRREGENWTNNESDEVICDLENDNILLLKDDIKNKRVRVKYLDKKDIESLGWKHTGKSIDTWFEIERRFEMSSWTSYKATMHYGLHDNRMYIRMSDTGTEGVYIFQGIIKNKSEFVKLLKQLNIL